MLKKIHNLKIWLTTNSYLTPTPSVSSFQKNSDFVLLDSSMLNGRLTPVPLTELDLGKDL